MMYFKDSTDNLNIPPEYYSRTLRDMPANRRETLIGLIQEDHRGRLQLIHALDCPEIVAPALETIFNAAAALPDELAWRLVMRIVQDIQRAASYPISEVPEENHE